MQMRCYRCGWSFALTREELDFAAEAIRSGAASHYDARCPRCRSVNKVSADQIRRAAPRPASTPPAESKLSS
jgi:hypothetical protein